MAQRRSKKEKKILTNGYYKDEETAARASDTLARELMANGEQNHKLNFLGDSTEVYAREVTKFKKLEISKIWILLREKQVRNTLGFITMKNAKDGSHKSGAKKKKRCSPTDTTKMKKLQLVRVTPWREN